MKVSLSRIVACLILPLGTARGQGLYAGVRAGAGIPTGDFSEVATGTGTSAALLHGASPGLGYGLDAGAGAGLLGLYASYDRIQFECKDESCATSGKYRLTGYAAGVRATVPLLALLKPWAKAGITYNETKGEIRNGANLVKISTGRSPGYEVGAGIDIPLLAGFGALTPQVRYVRQKLNPNGAGKRDANYYTFDIGLRIRTPL